MWLSVSDKYSLENKDYPDVNLLKYTFRELRYNWRPNNLSGFSLETQLHLPGLEVYYTIRNMALILLEPEQISEIIEEAISHYDATIRLAKTDIKTNAEESIQNSLYSIVALMVLKAYMSNQEINLSEVISSVNDIHQAEIDQETLENYYRHEGYNRTYFKWILEIVEQNPPKTDDLSIT